MYKQSIHCETCKGLLPLCAPCQKKIDDELDRRREKYKATNLTMPPECDNAVFDIDGVIKAINKAADRYCYHSVFAVWLQYRLQHDGDVKATERAILDTNRTLEKLNQPNHG